MSERQLTVQLTPEQRRVVELPATATALITAGAGAGKTTTLVSRIDRLLQGGLAPQQVLVLSFSRAAVARVKDGMRQLDQQPYARTFDGWALDLLMQLDSQDGWVDRTFDARIEAATQAIRAGSADELLDDLAHVVVDEVQDLVGARRELVQALLERFDCGFTVVGDLAQSIYGFQIAEVGMRAAEVGAFARWLGTTFGSDLVQLSLTENFRAVSDAARAALPFGPRLLAITSEADARSGRTLYEGLRTTLLGFMEIGHLEDPLVADLLRADGSSTAILCRTNGEALQVSERLQTARVPHDLRRDTRDRGAPAWVAGLFGSGGRIVGHEEFDGVVGFAPERLRLWHSMLKVAPASGGRSVDLSKVADLLRQGRLPDDLRSDGRSGVVISSYHRAKGLEFDCVVLTDPGPPRLADEGWDGADEARLLYVGMTRARREIYRLDQSWDRAVVRIPRSLRWGRTGWKSFHRTGMQFGSGDVHSADPGGTMAFAGDALDLQKHLAGHVAPGSEVLLRLRSGTPPSSLAEYVVLHEDREIGITSAALGQDLLQWLRVSPTWKVRSYPSEITSLRVDFIETVAGSPAAGAAAGLGDLGVWLAPRLTGLGRFHFNAGEQDND